ncbi:TPA: ead/Ea22-like family protein [Escherichia coli]|nr:ead/Ea22-like family protein [Escherichia coli]HDV1661204.1 ead/Ea22-like family protein [Escherichia coli]HDV2740243.1 ead/Ea22-like family protein [Escherichia coli]HDV2818063.1 ead/Ea22-like family protein [Escherichia coli]HDV2826295.1 ead/Ea22-like family protein [Escherichia coli]
MSKIDYQALREAAEKATWGDWDSYKPHRGARGYEVRLSSQAIAQHVLKNNAEFIAAFNPKVALALLDERERNQQYIKRRDQENEDIALTVGKLRVELEAVKSKLNEQREYYEGVIAYGGKRIAELVVELVSQTYKLNEMSGNSPVTPSVWMSCSERMPDDAQWCVVEAADGYYVQCWYEGQGWLGDDISLRNCDVIRWMAIPEPPEQDGE